MVQFTDPSYLLREGETAGSISDNIVEAIAESKEELSENISIVQEYLNSLPAKLLSYGIKLILAVIVFFICSKLIAVIRKSVGKSLDRAKADTGLKIFLDKLLRVVLYAVVILFIASFFGFETSSLMAVIGSAGITIALALQGSLSNFTGGVLILILRPFKVGDYIREDNKGNEGFVKEIGLFYTKLRTLDEKIVVLPNGTLANTSLLNYSESPFRRLILSVGISYESDIATAKRLIHDWIEKEEKVIHNQQVDIFVDALDSSSVNIVARFYVKNMDYFDVMWRYNEEIKNIFAHNGVTIPFPQVDVHMKESRDE